MANKDKKVVLPPHKLQGFSWGGNTLQWEAEAARFMNALETEIDNNKTDEEILKTIQQAKHNYQ